MLVKMVALLQISQGNHLFTYVACGDRIRKKWEKLCYSSLNKYLIYIIVTACSLKEGLELVKEAINRTGYGDKIKIAIDVAATNFCIGKLVFRGYF